MLFTGGNYGLDHWFDDYFNRDSYRDTRRDPYMMETDVIETQNAYLLEMNLPGYKKENIHAELKDGYLTVRAVREEDQERQGGRYIVRERYTGSCQRSFYVGDQLHQEDIRAAFENGILKLAIPKIDKRQIEEKPSYIRID